MSGFDDRKDQFEKKFAHDQALRFRAEAKRNRMLGEWAGGLLGHSGAALEDYVKAVIVADFKEAGDEDVFRKIREDFKAAGVDQSDHQIRRHMDEFMAKAMEQVMSEA